MIYNATQDFLVFQLRGIASSATLHFRDTTPAMIAGESIALKPGSCPQIYNPLTPDRAPFPGNIIPAEPHKAVRDGVCELSRST